MSFVTQEDVWNTMEPVMAGVFEEFADGKPVTPAGSFPRIPMPRRCSSTARTSRTCATRS
jgi:aspartyl-tRNA synthetase